MNIHEYTFWEHPHILLSYLTARQLAMRELAGSNSQSGISVSE